MLRAFHSLRPQALKALALIAFGVAGTTKNELPADRSSLGVRKRRDDITENILRGSAWFSQIRVLYCKVRASLTKRLTSALAAGKGTEELVEFLTEEGEAIKNEDEIVTEIEEVWDKLLNVSGEAVLGVEKERFEIVDGDREITKGKLEKAWCKIKRGKAMDESARYDRDHYTDAERNLQSQGKMALLSEQCKQILNDRRVDLVESIVLRRTNTRFRKGFIMSKLMFVNDLIERCYSHLRDIETAQWAPELALDSAVFYISLRLQKDETATM
ncbi:hypothetical protein CAPTEDRAFT_202661 [Capitella teleta]|uniref:BAR domain-containing protein n=1 Tax=Capitella teleta TaxID=283909 RepID=R7VGJ7_CAPTE|nr:hypothetical protein CAPTEDRAFT_202661 [Capitella teleta]|eukprot:ELU17978.1 hypothetical protein CAPTEDRAFT_202661 [Capitella teleta]